MAKKVKDIFQELADKSGGTLLGNEPPVRYYIDSGNLAVNYLCSGKFFGGGFPGERIIEILGPSSGGKSLWACNLARGIQILGGIPIYLDTENALNPIFAAKASHLDPYKMVRITPKDGIDCLERAFLKIHNIIRAVRERGNDSPLLFIYDSIAVSPSERELSETYLSENFTEKEWKSVVGNKEQPGERAKICNKEFRKLEGVLSKNNATLLVVNQVRQKIGVRYGNPEVGSTASTVLEFYSCVRLRLSAHKKIENKLKKIIGVNLKVKNIKNRLFTPFVVAENVQLFYEKGVNPLSGLLTLLLQEGRITTSGKGTYAIKEPWASGQEITFRANKTNNTIDAETLLKCPALVDAKDESEVQTYLDTFSEAINHSLSDDVVERELNDEEMDESEE